MLALDLFCGAGGASMGLHRAGFEVVGVDIRPQPRYPFRFVQADALEPPFRLSEFDFIWASPPCQAYTPLRALHDKTYPDLVAATREMLRGTLYVIENVPGAPIRRELVLCGTMFGLRSYRHRHFETSWFVWQPGHPPHRVPTFSQAGQHNRKARFQAGSFATVTGNVGTYCGPAAMGIDWMNGDELSQAIPPAYSEFIGRAALQHLRQAA
jgi:DNA (cytosine-5)-methyltransferase 1